MMALASMKLLMAFGLSIFAVLTVIVFYDVSIVKVVKQSCFHQTFYSKPLQILGETILGIAGVSSSLSNKMP